MSTFATLAAIAVSLGAIGRLAATDPKRRRAFDLPPFDGSRHARLLVALVLVPGPLLLIAGSGAAFVIWLGFVSVAGWVVAAISPTQSAWMRDRLSELADRAGMRGLFAGSAAGLERMIGAVGDRLSLPAPRSPASVVDTDAAARIAELERRVAMLEAALNKARHADAETPEEGRLARIA